MPVAFTEIWRLIPALITLGQQLTGSSHEGLRILAVTQVVEKSEACFRKS
jgi:hypothetical protein